ncbi:MAG TPA: type II toxin-antitoxin system RelE/ParE family toxin [Caulobacteraceae bacterium]|nr:type II toxin-antitoxin system RelE/ParE family toxin [Caulobacteraceae bacterium]
MRRTSIYAAVQAVIETNAYLRHAKEEGMTDDERSVAVSTIASDPEIGDLIVGSGGCRKVRIPRRGRGKSAGYRVVTYFAGTRVPVFLLAVLYKGSRDNFSTAEVNAMARAAKALVQSLGPAAMG